MSATSVIAQNPAPGKRDRLSLVDALRSFALLGLFLVHCLEYFDLYWIDQTLDFYISTALTALGIPVFIHLYGKNLPRRLLNLLAPCGRMSLSIYLLQALICVPLFYPFGLGWYQGIGQGGALLLGLAIFAALTAFAHLWMHRFHYGPAEWIWRAATLTTVKVPFLRRPYAREAIGF